MLQRWKMSPNDVQVMQLGSSPNMLASLDKGGIEGAVLTIPSMFVAEDRGYRVLLDMADTDIYYLHTMVATTRQYIKNNRDKVLRFLKGYVEGIAFVKQNKKESLDIVKKKLRIGPEQERNLERSFDLLIAKYYENDSLSVDARRRNRARLHRKRQSESQERRSEIVRRRQPAARDRSQRVRQNALSTIDVKQFASGTPMKTLWFGFVAAVLRVY